MLLRPQKAPSIRRLRPFLCIFKERRACRPWNVRPSTLRTRFLLSSLKHTQNRKRQSARKEKAHGKKCSALFGLTFQTGATNNWYFVQIFYNVLQYPANISANQVCKMIYWHTDSHSEEAVLWKRDPAIFQDILCPQLYK